MTKREADTSMFPKHAGAGPGHIRRYDTSKLWPAEKLLLNASYEIEAMGAHPKLTDVVMRLAEARAVLADYVDARVSDGIVMPDPLKRPDMGAVAVRFSSNVATNMQTVRVNEVWRQYTVQVPGKRDSTAIQRIDKPRWVAEQPSGAAYILSEDGTVHHVRAGWLDVSWQAEPDTLPFDTQIGGTPA